ncbi:HAD-IA family hydrolase [Desulfobulbus sp. US2]|nr:HAD-IA family hydrolase [Desulfobulbus sp. US4]MCW5204881.1 HAD-IA family hydrolase [Desulfobulbus sp. N2]MCW5208010.1 HAD-IA family hydrolase [Desulfobulbus sp. US2]MCW5210197.1 HAD-IA family hydrolase [Desulfobulbus sp. N3]MCW5213862.1 HAD-IA family hydrolase [Desulfobulbus sp. US5]
MQDIKEYTENAEQVCGYKIRPDFSWDDVETVMLDMDGTLLDKHFDDYFWEVYLPEHYSLLHNISVEEAGKELRARYQAVENSLQWADLEYWSHTLELDLPELKLRINHLIGVHPYVVEFLEFCLKKRKKLYLVTNAHSKALSIKLEKTSIGAWFDRVVCAEEVGFAKEEPEFWPRLQELLGFTPEKTLLVDDTEKVLRVADGSGLGYLIHIACSSSRRPACYSTRYPSIDYFKELIR